MVGEDEELLLMLLLDMTDFSCVVLLTENFLLILVLLASLEVVWYKFLLCNDMEKVQIDTRI